MKKYLAILLSLALVFCFISCDGSTKTPDGSNGSSSGSVTAVPKDSNVPDKSKLKDFKGDDLSVIRDISTALNDYNDFELQADLHETTWYKIGGGQILVYYVGGEPTKQGISGSYTVKHDVVVNDANQKDIKTYDGAITIGGVEYTLLSLACSETDKRGISLAGQVKKEGNVIDVSTLESSDPGLYYFLASLTYHYSEINVDEVAYTLDNAIFLLTIDTPDFVGAASYEAIKEGNLPVTDVVLNFSKVKLNDGNHSLTCNYKIDPNELVGGDPAIKVIYFSLDDTYFTPESIDSGVLVELITPF